MSLRDPLIVSGEGEFHSYLEDTETETGFSVAHLDHFLSRVYNYYLGKGFVCILLRNSLNLVTFIFTIFFATFLVSFVDYSNLAANPDDGWGSSIDFHRRLHPVTIICVSVFCLFWVWQFFQFLRHTRHNLAIKKFFSEKLGISETDLQTIEWQEVVQKIGTVKRLCRVKDYLTALDVSSRIMRKENYLIALINKDVLDLSIPVPFLRNCTIVTKTIEWSLTYALFNFVFDEHQSVQPDLLDPSKRNNMAKKLQKRFVFMGFLSFLLSPFIFLYLLVYFFFKYGEDLRTTPGSVLGSREWTPLARWRFREFNELPHYLHARLIYSIKPANTYINQFPINSVTIIARFVAFIASSGLVVLFAVGFWNEEVLLMSTIYGKGTLWYAGVLGTVVAVCRGIIPDENALFEPQNNLDEVSGYTHYWPKDWQRKAHSYKVRDEFSALFEFRAKVFLQELLGVLFSPFVLIFSLSGSSVAIVDFFREFTVEVPGVGFVCSCSSFTHAEKHVSERFGTNSSAPKDMQTKHGKLEKSILTFKVNNPKWAPCPQAEEMFGNMSQFITTTTTAPDPHDIDSYSNHSARNFLQESMMASPALLSQSVSMLRAPSVVFAPDQTTTNLDPKALAFLHKVHQKFHEAKDHPSPRTTSTSVPTSTSIN